MDTVSKLKTEILSSIKNFFFQTYHFSLSTKEEELLLTRKEFDGEFTFVTFPFVSRCKKKHDEIAEELGKFLLKNTHIIDKYNVVVGFLNLNILQNIWKTIFDNIYFNDSFYQFLPKNKTVLIEFSSPNANKPLHLGHLRNNFIGMAVANILETYGYRVKKICLVNDRGIHICKSMLAYMLYGNEEQPGENIKGDKLVGKYYVLFEKKNKEGKNTLIEQARELLRKWENNDKSTLSLWGKMRKWVLDAFEESYAFMGVKFDKYYMESDTYLFGKRIIKKYTEKGVFYKKKDNSICIDLTKENYDEKILLRSDGTSVYITQDIGNAFLRYEEFKMDKSIYIVGNEQNYHFEILKIILKKIGFRNADHIHHLSYGMVHLPSGKMKSREGTVIDADDMIQEMIEIAEKRTNVLGKIKKFKGEGEAKKIYYQLAMGALKFFLLKVDCKKDILFEKEKSINFQGDTGVYIQYNFTKIQSILRLADTSWQNKKLYHLDTTFPLTKTEKRLILLISLYPEKISEAARILSPSILANYSLELAKWYSKYYVETHILKEENKELRCFRLMLSFQVAKTLELSMKLIGIGLPKTM